MAGLLRKRDFRVVVYSRSTQPAPDVDEVVSAITERFAVVEVMRAHGIAYADTVYIQSATGEAWLDGVQYLEGDIVYSRPVEQSSVAI